MSKLIHEGKNIKRFREMLGIKQETLAAELGDDWTQSKISLLEAKEMVGDDLLEQVAAILKVPKEAIKNFDEEAAVNIVSNTFTDFKDNASGINNYCEQHFNPVDKWLTALDENKKLYEALLKSEREKIALYEKMLSDRDKIGK